MKIRRAKPDDCPTVSRMMENLIDEIYKDESEDVRHALKANFTADALKEFCHEEYVVMYLGEIKGDIAAFLFGYLFHGVLTVYWLYVKKKYRGRGLIKELLNHVEQVLIREGCYKIEMYAYAKHNRFLDYSSRLGFKKGVKIEESMFGFPIQNIYKYIGDYQKADKEKKIKIMGEAGQGVKLLSTTLASILTNLGHEVSLNLEYDSAVRSGKISADLIYSDDTIANPIIDEADILIKFTRAREWFPARNLIIDESICEDGPLQCEIKTKKGTDYGLQDVAVSQFGSKIFINMIALGRILRYIGINIMLLNIKDLLPPKRVDKNIAAVKYGFKYRDDI